MKIILFLIFSLLILWAYGNEKGIRVKKSLKLAGDNQRELKQVLEMRDFWLDSLWTNPQNQHKRLSNSDEINFFLHFCNHLLLNESGTQNTDIFSGLISMNDVYEDRRLLFHGALNGQHSLHKKEVTDFYTKYENVPPDTLYWVRNPVIGTEERIFTR